MAKNKKQGILACPPGGFHWIEDIDDLDKLGIVYSKLMSISAFFSTFQSASLEKPAFASEVYGYWFILRDICNTLSEILKIDHWTGEVGRKAIEEGSNESNL